MEDDILLLQPPSPENWTIPGHGTQGGEICLLQARGPQSA